MPPDNRLHHKRFQSTLPRGERPSFSLHRTAHYNFNPRSREGSDLQRQLAHLLPADFNPRSREGSDFSLLLHYIFRTISIHAPARGATGNGQAEVYDSSDFNPRSREGSDRRRGSIRPSSGTISIHAPARGATVSAILTPPICAISIHAPARGATPSHNLTPAYRTDFNPRSREGSDYYWVSIAFIFFNFNPRSREGSDKIFANGWKIIY